MIESALAGLWAGYGLAVPVGAVAVLMVNMTAQTSFRIGASAALGATTADVMYAVIAVTGGATVAGAIQPFSTPLRWVAFGILAFMAIRIFITAMRRGRAAGLGERQKGKNLRPLKSYTMFLGLTALNPWPAIYFVALILGRQSQERMSGTDSVVYVLAIAVASASWQLLLAGGGAIFGRLLTGARGRVLTAMVSSVLILGLGVSMVMDQ
ncbi:LysE/ArgO family amino acid transporter [Streptomyces sp. GS7]|uniref:LysE/ArgO family amino acid transporter n=1 Tax=Streptomyces sp. GS7 TaxID=2692234 RepID=UPI001316C79E|nr:LysE family transporter [Streptomyces sp. GS7]QHC22084.1 LysE family transporter [Streptomyces sp. GS7]